MSCLVSGSNCSKGYLKRSGEEWVVHYSKILRSVPDTSPRVTSRRLHGKFVLDLGKNKECVCVNFTEITWNAQNKQSLNNLRWLSIYKNEINERTR